MSRFRCLNHSTVSTSGSVTTTHELVSRPKRCNRPRGDGTVVRCKTRPLSFALASVSRQLTSNEQRIARSDACFFSKNSATKKRIITSLRQPVFLISCSVGKNYWVGETTVVTMPAAMVDSDYYKFDAVLNAAEVQGSGALLLLFLANRDSALGKSWCPDCVRAEPVIYKVIDGTEKPVTLLRIYVGDRPTWRNPEHALKKDSRFALKGVPTLIRWENGGITGRLEDYEAHVEENVRKLIS